MRTPLAQARLNAYPETRRSKAVTSIGDLMRLAFSKVPETEVNRPHFRRFFATVALQEAEPASLGGRRNAARTASGPRAFRRRMGG